VRHQLGAVDHDQDAALAGRGGEGAQVRQPAGDVGAAGDGQHARPRVLVQRGLDGGDVEGPVHVDVDDPQPGVPPPGQQVGVVLHGRGDDDVVLGEAEAEGQQVERLGGVAREEGEVRARVAADEAHHDLARLLVPLARELRADAGAPVHARVPGEELLDRSGDGHRGRAGGGGVEVDVLARPAVQHGHPQVVAHVLTGREGQRDLHGNLIDIPPQNLKDRAEIPPRGRSCDRCHSHPSSRAAVPPI
jgi:hypothetical protein